ncbi:MAG: thiamine-phosphate kinase [Rhizomicrobium sp.]|jgi:thiamine-monophosphate kinase
MTSSISESRLGEFELIRELFAPLSRGLPGARNLQDDVATIECPAGHEVVLKTDALVEDVHFLKSDPARSVAKKALRVNLSDFAAKGADPRAYLLVLALPEWVSGVWLREFAEGLAEDQAEFGIALAGGDTVGTPGALTIAVTMTGFVSTGETIRRDGAKPGDIVFVTGTIGDAAGGLDLLRSELLTRETWPGELIARYRIPSPRLAFGRALRGTAHAALDVSDGLIADLGHIAEVSRVRIDVDATRVPLSDAYRQMFGGDTPSIVRAATAGDDYEIAFATAPSQRDRIQAISLRTQTRVTEIGRVTAGNGVVMLDGAGDEIPFVQKGFVHF